MSIVKCKKIYTKGIYGSLPPGPNDPPGIQFNPDGTVTKPFNQVFYGWRDTGVEAWENFGTTPVTYIYNIARINDGSYYNTGTGVYTCNNGGVYLIHAGFLGSQLGSYTSLFVYKNNINVTAAGIHANVGNYWTVNSQVFAIQCNTNDQLTIKILTGDATVYGREHSHLAIWFYG